MRNPSINPDPPAAETARAMLRDDGVLYSPGAYRDVIRALLEGSPPKAEFDEMHAKLYAVQTGEIIAWELDQGELGLSVTWANGQRAAWAMKVAPIVKNRLIAKTVPAAA